MKGLGSEANPRNGDLKSPTKSTAVANHRSLKLGIQSGVAVSLVSSRVCSELIYLVSEVLLTFTRRSRSATGTKQDRSLGRDQGGRMNRGEDGGLRIEKSVKSTGETLP